MKFIHESPDFPALLDTVAAAGPIASPAMVEKDYWICHSLWALELSGIEFWFKGGTSLSKSFDIIQRFSEDLDLIILPGQLSLPKVTSWKTETAGATRSRQAFWQQLLSQIEIQDTELNWDQEHDPSQRNIGIRVSYRGHLVEQFRTTASIIKPFVLLEMSHGSIARSRRAPSVKTPISSAVHDWLIQKQHIDTYVDNRPGAVQSVHPYVTLIEKLDAITRRYGRADNQFNSDTIARHYEDAAQIISSESSLPAIDGSLLDLAREMLQKRNVRRLVTPDDEALTLTNTTRRKEIQQSYTALEPMHWGKRIPLEKASLIIIDWLRQNGF